MGGLFLGVPLVIPAGDARCIRPLCGKRLSALCPGYRSGALCSWAQEPGRCISSEGRWIWAKYGKHLRRRVFLLLIPALMILAGAFQMVKSIFLWAKESPRKTEYISGRAVRRGIIRGSYGKKERHEQLLDAEPVSAKRKSGTRPPEKARQGEVRAPRQKEKTVSGKPAERQRRLPGRRRNKSFPKPPPAGAGAFSGPAKSGGDEGRAEAPRARSSQVSAGTGRSRLAQEDSWASRRVESSPARPAREKPLRRMEEADLPIKKRRRMSGRGVMISAADHRSSGRIGISRLQHIRRNRSSSGKSEAEQRIYHPAFRESKPGRMCSTSTRIWQRPALRQTRILTLEGIEYTFPQHHHAGGQRAAGNGLLRVPRRLCGDGFHGLYSRKLHGEGSAGSAHH